MPGKCDREGGQLIQRPDDKIDVVANRLRKYNLETAPLIAHYQHKGILTEIDGEQDIEKVYADIAAALKVSTNA